MMRRITIVILFLGMLFLSPLNISYADNAEVIPKGVSRIELESRIFFPIDERYDPDGNVEDIATDYNTTLDSRIFPGLEGLETPHSTPPFGGLPPGTANVGDSVVSFEWDLFLSDLKYQYGVTDRFSVGIKVPYWFQKNNVDATIDNTNATVGKSALANSLVRLDAPLPDVEKITDEDIQHLLGPGLDINNDGTIDIEGYGYNRVETYSDNGISDIEVGGRYQYLNTDNWRLAFTGGVRLPTGEVDDPDTLQDRGFGTGAWGLLFHLNNDYVGIKNFVFDVSLKYDLILPDKEELRVPDDVNKPLTRNKEEVDRDIGDIFQIDTSATYQFLPGLNFALRYLYGTKMKDRVSGSQDYNYQSLEDETDWTEHVFFVGLGYSTIPLYQEKKFSVPLTVNLSYRNRFAGSNNVNKSEYIGINIAVFF